MLRNSPCTRKQRSSEVTDCLGAPKTGAHGREPRDWDDICITCDCLYRAKVEINIHSIWKLAMAGLMRRMAWWGWFPWWWQYDIQCTVAMSEMMSEMMRWMMMMILPLIFSGFFLSRYLFCSAYMAIVMMMMNLMTFPMIARRKTNGMGSTKCLQTTATLLSVSKKSTYNINL